VEQAVKHPEKTIHHAVHKVEKKAEHIAKQAVHGIMKTEQNVERTVHQVGKNVEKSLHEFSKHPIDSTVEFVRGAGDAALADVTFNVVQRPYNSKHPVAYQAGQMVGHAVSTLAGMVETTGFAAVGTGGIVLDATGVGAVAGAPATAIAAAGVTHGATLTATGSANFAKSAKELYQRMSRSEGVSGGVSKGTGKGKGVSQAGDDIPRISEIKVRFKKNPKHDAVEFERQLKAQEEGLNSLTVDEYLKNRDRYLKEGRSLEGNAAQQAAREKAYLDKVNELRRNGLSRKEAEKKASEWIKGQAALHNPDQIAGGNPLNISGMGDKRINSSIGSQWKYKIDEMDKQIRSMAKNMTEAERKSTRLNVKLTK
jgi:hypothetical protein